ncbi:hypothetical protein AVEN_265324-1 [Araneus ventricosus]|uniref:Uncharacterized protein n=1 Tax=Araneus ventricosus TaxID=182803 RepID=A0A4Y2MMT5_ARAVE|nr:hypothetical protein AVEN_265324-1 [Araneus ventricosus]
MSGLTLAPHSGPVSKLVGWFESQHPFPVSDCVMSISTGILGDERINCHRASEYGNSSMICIVLKIFEVKPKEHHPALPKHPGKQLKDWPPQHIVRHCASCIIDAITSVSCSNPRFTAVRHVIGSGPKEPHHHYCATGLTRAYLIIRQPLLREHTVSSVELESERFLIKQATEYAYHLIVTSAIAAAEEHKDSELVGEDMDITPTALESPSTNAFILVTRERKLTDQPVLCQQF